MKRMVVHAAAALAVAAIAAAWSSSARAETIGPQPQTRAPRYVLPQREVVQHQEEQPNTGLITSGLFTLGLSYGASAIVAYKSDHPGDDQLYVPVAGPWMDLAHRGECGAAPGQHDCTNESTYKVLLVADGVFQGLGALEILGGFLFPETRTYTSTAAKKPAAPAPAFAPTVHVTPSRMGLGGYGISAYGTF